MGLLPAPEQSNQHADQPHERQRRRRHGVLSADDCLAAISAIPRLVTMGLLRPSEANAIRAACQTILNHYSQQDAFPNRCAVDRPGLRQALREKPQLANFLVGLLSDEEIADLLSGEERTSP